METNAFIDFMQKRINANLTRATILDTTNKVQNEILSHNNYVTKITPDPFLHTGSIDFTNDGSNTAGSSKFAATENIPLTTPTKGFLLITESGITDKLQYTSYLFDTFTLSNGVSLPRSYTTSATTTVDKFDIIASGAIFSSVANSRTEQFDVRKVHRLYSFQDRISKFRSFGRGRRTSFRQETIPNFNADEIDRPTDSVESERANREDCKVIIWRENAPGVTSEVFIADAQRWPEQLTTESVNITIPERFQTTLLRYGILRDAEYKEYGSADRPEALYDKYLSEFLAESRQKTSTTPNRVVPRF